MIPAVMMTVSLVEGALFAKLLYESKGNASTAAREFRGIKNLLLRPMSTKDIQAMIKIFEKTGKLEVQAESNKPVTLLYFDTG